MRIVYIEDEQDIRTITVRFLEMIYPEAEIEELDDLPSAVSQDIDLIVTDCNLPSGDFCSVMKNLVPDDLPIVLVTGDHNKRCRGNNCTTCHKPYSIEQLKSACQIVLDQI